MSCSLELTSHVAHEEIMLPWSQMGMLQFSLKMRSVCRAALLGDAVALHHPRGKQDAQTLVKSLSDLRSRA